MPMMTAKRGLLTINPVSGKRAVVRYDIPSYCAGRRWVNVYTGRGDEFQHERDVGLSRVSEGQLLYVSD